MKRLLLVLALTWIISSVAIGGAKAAEHRSFQDCPHCPALVDVPPGSFVMGVPASEEQRENVPENFRGRSAPQTRVTIGKAFAIGAYPVDPGRIRAVRRRGRAYEAGDRCFVYAHGQDGWAWQETVGKGWRDPGFPQTDRDPVVCVSWHDAEAYVAWLSKVTGRHYRLPSEAEGEYAARGGTQTARFWGDGRADACRYANVADTTMFSTLGLPAAPEANFDCSDGFVFTALVGSFPANPFGLYDMLGNVWQWLEDCWHPTLADRPVSGVVWVDGGDCTFHSARGGSWQYYPWSLRAGFRYRDDASNRNAKLGFRVARDM